MILTRSTLILILIIFLQWVFLIGIPFLLYNLFIKVTIYPWSRIIDQVFKAILAGFAVLIWLLEWYYICNIFYRWIISKSSD